MPGADGIGVAEFAKRLQARLDELSRLIVDGGYEAQPLREVSVTRSGRPRRRGIPTVCDRVAQRAFLAVCADRLDTTDTGSAAASFAYQRGRSWRDALDQAAHHRDQGLRWVFRADIQDFFAAVRHADLAACVDRCVGDPEVTRLVTSWVAAPALTDAGLRRRSVGIPEGAPVSPTLANLYLRDFDRSVHGRDGQLVRYADDIALFCRSERDAIAGGQEIESILRRLGLRLNPAKTHVASFDGGFTMLGWVFDAAGGRPQRDQPGVAHPSDRPDHSWPSAVDVPPVALSVVPPAAGRGLWP